VDQDANYYQIRAKTAVFSTQDLASLPRFSTLKHIAF
jgi:hypothetical protein